MSPRKSPMEGLDGQFYPPNGPPKLLDIHGRLTASRQAHSPTMPMVEFDMIHVVGRDAQCR